MPIVSVSMPADLIDRLDTHAADHDYTGRSEVVRESARTLLAEFEDDRLEDRPLAGVVSVFYEFGSQRVERRVTELRHEYDDVVASTDHGHVGEGCGCPSCDTDRDPESRSEPGYFVDLFVLEGDLEAMSTFVGTLRAIEAVDRVDYSLVPLDSIGQLRDG
ncbi:transcriptional regulator NikR, CopG family [Haloterrigena turkmenica DSM 5511]|uniref:Transcriptional regulator NikR, CopG family n=1 Tax=Haloterrigena turkmenica (strain ATCC 51198 / DSM 5511 / JCM 9101 / NCIMB 13204 / VKM B-1734 / 4k) TaxID=543526 RepID=D2RV27_HALTV|nr:CopG family ribbon-helix-helix protein [Haloterrigena turkmenica]ADB59320.1 transcriptional regulator NikR, CopG family [Haloterrigena turkmenica DSM 5511]